MYDFFVNHSHKTDTFKIPSTDPEKKNKKKHHVKMLCMPRVV